MHWHCSFNQSSSVVIVVVVVAAATELKMDVSVSQICDLFFYFHPSPGSALFAVRESFARAKDAALLGKFLFAG